MLACRHCVSRLRGMEERRTDDGHGLHWLFEQPTVGREASETTRRRHSEPLAERVDPVPEIVGCSDHVVAAMLLEEVGDPGAPAAAADHSQVQFSVRRGAAGHTRTDHRQGERGGTGLEKATPRDSARRAQGVRVAWWHWHGASAYHAAAEMAHAGQARFVLECVHVHRDR